MKIHWLVKALTFVASVITLSGFFAGWRQIHQIPNIAAWSLLLGSIMATLLLLLLQGFWIYADEKQKGTLCKRIGLFENLYAAMVSCKPSKDTTHSCCGTESKKA